MILSLKWLYRSLQLGYKVRKKVFLKLKAQKKFQVTEGESNPQPSDYRLDAPPAELQKGL